LRACFAVSGDAGFSLSRPVSANAGKLSGSLGTGDAGAGGDALGGFVLAGVRLATFGIKKKPSAPLLRLAYIHLLASFSRPVGLYNLSAAHRQSNSRFARGQRNLTLLHEKNARERTQKIEVRSCRRDRHVIMISLSVSIASNASTARVFR
jgi:hypothetical protein